MGILADKLLMCSSKEKLYVDDVFSTYVRTGTGVESTITTNVDMTKGFLLWSKSRSAATDHALYDSERGVAKDLASNATSTETTQAQGLKSFSKTGHTWGTLAKVNTSSATYADWVFRKAKKFFDVKKVNHTTGAATTVGLSSLGTVGMVIVKSTNVTTDWWTWHRSLTSGKLLCLNSTNPETTSSRVSVSGTNLTFSPDAETGTYIIYGFAHNPDIEGFIQCGSYVGGSSNTDQLGDLVNLGWEPQYVLIKATQTGAAGNQPWLIFDNIRGMVVGGDDKYLLANVSDVEVGANYIEITSDGFRPKGGVRTNEQGYTYIYMAIRRPNKPPKIASEVFAISNVNVPVAPGFRSGFPVDMAFSKITDTISEIFISSRLTQQRYMATGSTGPELTSVGYMFDYMDGWSTIAGTGLTNYSWMFKRAPGFLDVVCYTGAGAVRTVNHNLGVVPELIIIKGRNTVLSWYVYHEYLGATKRLLLNFDYPEATNSGPFNNTEPTSNVFTAGLDLASPPDSTFIAYLFATLQGISKVDSYTGNGTSQAIDCGFAAGARFILIKRTDASGDWYFWDSLRGIVAANDPHLSLNTTAAEVTTDDSVDPATSGFIVNQVAATNINVLNGKYIFLAIT